MTASPAADSSISSRSFTKHKSHVCNSVFSLRQAWLFNFKGGCAAAWRIQPIALSVCKLFLIVFFSLRQAFHVGFGRRIIEFPKRRMDPAVEVALIIQRLDQDHKDWR